MLDLKSLIPFHHESKSREVARQADVAVDPFTAMRREMDRMFDNFLTRSGSMLAAGGSDGGSIFANAGLASLEVKDGEKQMTISAELPGMDEKDVDVRINGDLLTIEGEKKEESEKKEGECTYSERRYGKFVRTIRLPFPAGDQKVEASFDKGVLNIVIEKPAEQQTAAKHIEIKSAS